MKGVTLAMVAVLAIVLLAGEKAAPPVPAAAGRFNPPPLDDAWSNWIVGEWTGTARSNSGEGTATLRVEPALNGQFLVFRGRARITAMTPEQAGYLKRNMHATDAEIERFKESGYQSLEFFTIHPKTGEVVAYLFDNLRCMATGRGHREGNREIIDWVWRSGHHSTRVTEKLGEDRLLVTEVTPMPDGSLMEDRGEMTRQK